MANTVDIIRQISKKVRIEMIQTFDDIDRDQFGLFCEYYNLPFIYKRKTNEPVMFYQVNHALLIKFIKELRSIQRVPFKSS